MAPYLNMILKADINRIYDEKYLEAEQAKKRNSLTLLKRIPQILQVKSAEKSRVGLQRVWV